MTAWRNMERQSFLHAGMRAEVLQRELVQKTVHQLGEYNQESNGSYLAPLMVYSKFNKSWDKKVQGLSEE
jgi:hypothetical protein